MSVIEYLSYHLKVFPGLLLVVGISTGSEAQIYFDTHADSKLWLEGTSTVHRFDCAARSIQGTAYVEEQQFQDHTGDQLNYENAYSGNSENKINTGSGDNGGDSRPLTTEPSGLNISRIHGVNNDNQSQSGLHVHLKIPIESFDCGRSRMNRDMYEALRAEQYDYITFEFENATLVEDPSGSSDTRHEDGFKAYLIEGVLNVAGVDRHITLTALGRKMDDGEYRIKGQKVISMPDFDIEPPTALRGLIRAHEDLTVFFDLLVHAISEES